MNESIARRLQDINRQFYAEHAEAFADTRPRLAAGVKQVLAAIPPGAKVLEVGCGDGKVGRALARAGVGLYVGVDASEAMIQRAIRFTKTDDRRPTTAGEGKTRDEGRKATPEGEAGTKGRGTQAKDEGRKTENVDSVVDRPSQERPLAGSVVSFWQADITRPGWHASLPLSQFDWVLAFAVLHHIPGTAQRALVLKDLAARLAAGGTLTMSNWQLTRSERLMRRIRPWSDAGLTDADVEAGDFLLSWERSGRRGLRYVHVIDEAEARSLAEPAGLRVVEVFEADGVSGDLAEYVGMRRDE